METLLAKFRIDFEEVIILTDIAKKADTSTAMEFDELVEGMNVSDEELHLEREKTNRYKLKNFRYILMIRNIVIVTSLIIIFIFPK